MAAPAGLLQHQSASTSEAVKVKGFYHCQTNRCHATTHVTKHTSKNVSSKPQTCKLVQFQSISSISKGEVGEMNMMQRSRVETGVVPSWMSPQVRSMTWDCPKSRAPKGKGADIIFLSFVHRKQLLQMRVPLITAHLLQAHWSKRAKGSCTKARPNLLSDKLIFLYNHNIFLLLKLEDFYELDFIGLVFPQEPFWELLPARPRRYGRRQRMEAGQEEFNRNCFFQAKLSLSYMLRSCNIVRRSVFCNRSLDFAVQQHRWAQLTPSSRVSQILTHSCCQGLTGQNQRSHKHRRGSSAQEQ